MTLPDLNQKVKGTVERIAPIMDAKSGTQEISVLIENPRERLRSGTRCLLNIRVPATSQPDRKTRPVATFNRKSPVAN